MRMAAQTVTTFCQEDLTGSEARAMEHQHHVVEHQSGRGGLADALKQYGVLRSHSITQQAGIQIEEKKLHLLEKRLDEEKQKVSLPPCLPPVLAQPPGAFHRACTSSTACAR